MKIGDSIIPPYSPTQSPTTMASSAPSSKKLADFPDVEAKLQKPSRQSAFEKQKADAEAKRKREAAETAAVYESFVRSFDHDDDGDDAGAASTQHGAFGGRQQGGISGRDNNGRGGGLPKRHFGSGLGGSSNLKSGPGSLGPIPTSFGKRKFDNHQQISHRKAVDETRGRLGFHDDDSDDGHAPKPKGLSKVFDASDDEADARSKDLAEQKAIAKPTLRLANLPPGTSPAVIKALIPPSLTVENVKIFPPSAAVSTERRSMTAIITLSKATPATDIEAAVSSLQNRYLGYGFYLSLHRHLSSAVTSALVTSNLTSSSTSHPFGAKPVPQTLDPNPHHSGGFHRGFAPPSSYGPGGGPVQRNILYVPVQAPRDIRQLQLIHKVVESVLAHGPEFEALLMARPDVQKEEKWAWLWDARSEGGVWYRWRLWEIVTGARPGRKGQYVPLFEGSHAWRIPEKDLPFEYATAIDEFVSDAEYNSSEEEDYEEEGNKPADAGDNENTYLNPLDKARLTHLLARLPTTLAKIRKGDIARVTTFAITHASRGADEIVDMIVANITKPFALTSANPERNKAAKNEEDQAGGEAYDAAPLSEDPNAKSAEAQDTSASSLIGLYVVSDILSSSATSGVRHAWRYRQLFEASLKESRVFEILGLIAERLNWGRLRAEKWKRSVKLVLNLWEGWCAFPHESQKIFTETFENPPGAKKEEQADEAAKKGKWKTVEAGSGTTQSEGRAGFVPVSSGGGAGHDDEDGGMEVDDDVDGEAMDDRTWVDYEDLDTDIDGVPMDDDEDGEPMDETGAEPAAQRSPVAETSPIPDKSEGDNGAESDRKAEESVTDAPSRDQISTTLQPRRRMKAVDMFADSDDSDNGS
ncbi:hypothetical protein GGS23DRAFT_617405 [Durotheca rogersii]|uniref:uncharacterized protein n=1 Tax=Durotheca rogersii TaxID=419775 RepID=UPI002220BDA2|nr:uncharacterized protein GGS23DRAFT_617405 [Durotheca rogersii]KAI5866319.1 hypothetical protein GGS23DRAFT_617405 [Durotheca rogersii]